MDKSRTNSDKFLIIYNELDKYMRNYLEEKLETPNSYLIKTMAQKNRVFSMYKEDLLAFSKLRNVIVHNPYKKNADPIAEPHEYIVKKYEEIKNQVIYPPVALNTVAIPWRNIFTTTMESKALDVMREMVKNSYTHVPVVDNGKTIGIFSENTVFSYISKHKDVILLEDSLISEFKDFIDIDRNESEYYEFVGKNTLLIEIEEMFQKGFKDNKRLAVVFITENGKQSEKLLGLITVWDLAGYQK